MELGKVLPEDLKARVAAFKAEQKAKREEAFERSMLQVIKDHIEAGRFKAALGVLKMHGKRFPESVIKAQAAEWEAFLESKVRRVEVIRNGQVDLAAFKQEMSSCS